MAAPHPDPLTAAKSEARRLALARRAGCAAGVGEALARRAIGSGLIPSGGAVSAFWPIGDEIDTVPLLHALHGLGCAVGLPETPPRGGVLSFRRWRPGAPMVAGRFGTRHPDAPVLEPGLLLVPLLAFDRQGRRLGYGGGYYDRTLAALPGRRAVGLAYAAQEVDAVPAGPLDRPLDAVVTERGVLMFPH